MSIFGMVCALLGKVIT